MLFHPNLRSFGRLELYEIYGFYDSPILVSCRSAVGTIYIALAIDEHEHADDWLYVAVSQERFIAVRSGAIDLHSAFSEPEDGVAYVASIPHDEHEQATVATMDAAQLTSDMLPMPGELIRLETETLPPVTISLPEEASRTRRDILRLGFKLPAIFRSEAPAKFVGQVLASLQDSISAFGQSQEGEAGRRGALRQYVQAANEMAVLAFGGGSFEIKLASAGTSNLFGETETTGPLREFLSLLKIGSQAEQLQAHLGRLPPRAAANYLKFLRSLDDKIQLATAELASPTLGAVSETATLSAVTVRAAISALEYETFSSREQFDAVGRLVGASLDKMTFELRYGSKKREYLSGEISEEAFLSVKGAILDARYRAKLERLQSIKMTSGEVVEVLRLLSLEPDAEHSDDPEAESDR